ncbi:MAG: hypothetical protein LBB79_04520 [Prevotellaceae bacterium]|jgi:hypothetical protein|nr:hypothetical protein [Prevotellaceae bacterium]
MKQPLLPIVFATFFVACDKKPEYPTLENQIDLTGISIKERPCETLEYVGRIGNDFDAALDSLRNLKAIVSEIGKQPLEVLFDCDSRQFYGIAYGECGMYTDVLDTKGNYYLRSHYCPSEENVVEIEEEAIFKDKPFKDRIFTYAASECGKIIYAGRIGNDFDSALDSLKIMNKQLLAPYGEDGYNVEKEKVVINFPYDDREFFRLTFKDKKNTYNWFIYGIVIDEKGNYFHDEWCDEG